MARPPKFQSLERPVTYFQTLCSYAEKELKLENIDLNFLGYTETIDDYINLEEYETEKAWRLAKELNAWSEYMSDIMNLVKKTLFRLRNFKD